MSYRTELGYSDYLYVSSSGTNPSQAPRLTVEPTALALDLNDVKLHARVEVNDEDDLIGIYIAAAIAHLDGWDGVLGRALITQTWQQDFYCFSDVMRLPLDPVQSIVSITFFDENNEQQTLDDALFQLLRDGGGPYITLAPGLDNWPNTFDRLDAVTVTFVAGYGDTADDIPANLRHAMLLMVSSWFENREAVIVGTGAMALPLGVAALLSPYRRRTL